MKWIVTGYWDASCYSQFGEFSLDLAHNLEKLQNYFVFLNLTMCAIRNLFLSYRDGSPSRNWTADTLAWFTSSVTSLQWHVHPQFLPGRIQSCGWQQSIAVISGIKRYHPLLNLNKHNRPLNLSRHNNDLSIPFLSQLPCHVFMRISVFSFYRFWKRYLLYICIFKFLTLTNCAI